MSTVYTDQPEAEFTQAEHKKIERYAVALHDLCTKDRQWSKNLSLYLRWDTGQRLWWIDTIEQQAIEGKNTIGAKLVAHVITMRLED